MGIITRMDSRGDGTVVEWNASNSESVQKARTSFRALKDAGFAFFSMTADRSQGEPYRGEFDPSVGVLLAVPRMAGG